MANTRITQGVIKPNEDYDVRHINATGIVTAASVDVTNNLSVGGVLTYEDVTNVDSVGLITARKGIISTGVVTATAFHGSGASLTGIDATALKDTEGNVKVQAQASGAVHTGISTFDTIKVGSGVTIESNGQATFVGVVTFGPSSTKIDNNTINVGTALTLGHTQGLQFHTQNLHSEGFEINQINASGIITASSFSGDGSNLTSLPAGLGTALSSTQSSPLNKIYYTNSVLPVESTITVDTPASASAAYTQYTDISLGSGADLIISDGDDLIPDVLGLRPDGTFGGGSLGRMRVDKLVGKDANSAVNVEKGLVVTGVVTATSFSGDGSALTGIAADKIFEGNTEAEVVDTGSDGHFKVTTEGSERFRITSAGNIGVNVTSPDRKLHVGGSFIRVDDGYGLDTSGATERVTLDNGFIALTTNSNERLRIDSSGRVMIGDNDTDNAFTGGDDLVIGNTSARAGITLVSSSSQDGGIYFSKGTSSDQVRGQIVYQHAGNGGYMRLYTNANERLRITATGQLEVGNTNTINSGDFALIEAPTSFNSGETIVTIAGDSATTGPRLNLQNRNTGANACSEVLGADAGGQSTSYIRFNHIDQTNNYGEISFGTRNAQGTPPTEVMRINKDGLVSKPSTPFVMVHINTSTNRQQQGNQYIIPWDTIHGNSTNSNVGSHFNTSNHRFTAPVDGRYFFCLSMNIVADNIVYHRINGTERSKGEYRIADNVWDHVDASFIYDMNANDYYETYSQLYTSNGQRWNGGGTSAGGWDTLCIYLLG